jgi:hypothetical protein
MDGGTLARVLRMNRLRVRLGLVMAMLLLGAGAASARPIMDHQPAVKEEHGLVERAWSWLTAVFDRFGATTDPSGNDAVIPSPGPTSPLDPDL